MKKIVTTENKPIKLWLEDIEDGAMEQARHLANLPFTYKWVAIMPDSHQGYGMPIGGVLPVKDVIIPNAVGVDIGCGMCAVKTNLTELDQETIKKIFGGSKEFHGGIRTKVPVGFSHHSKAQDDKYMPTNTDYTNVVAEQLEPAKKQIGTLGGGNHFIEIQKGNDGFVWIMIHSGSRNIGFTVANFYHKLSRKINQDYRSEVPLEWDLAFLPFNSKEGKDYFKDMKYCVDFAYANRRLMLNRIQESFLDVLPQTEFEKEINIAHNYAGIENHGDNVIIHRKGATSAKEGEIGIIPGSQGTKSYIVKGRGNKESFRSCSHGAGRKMGRMAARRTLGLQNEIELLNKQGVVHSVRTEKDLDEAPSAYKDINIVMKNQEDLVDILVELQPLAVIKG